MNTIATDEINEANNISYLLVLTRHGFRTANPLPNYDSFGDNYVMRTGVEPKFLSPNGFGQLFLLGKQIRSFYDPFFTELEKENEPEFRVFSSDVERTKLSAIALKNGITGQNKILELEEELGSEYTLPNWKFPLEDIEQIRSQTEYIKREEIDFSELICANPQLDPELRTHQAPIFESYTKCENEYLYKVLEDQIRKTPQFEIFRDELLKINQMSEETKNIIRKGFRGNVKNLVRYANFISHECVVNSKSPLRSYKKLLESANLINDISHALRYAYFDGDKITAAPLINRIIKTLSSYLENHKDSKITGQKKMIDIMSTHDTTLTPILFLFDLSSIEEIRKDLVYEHLISDKNIMRFKSGSSMIFEIIKKCENLYLRLRFDGNLVPLSSRWSPKNRSLNDGYKLEEAIEILEKISIQKPAEHAEKMIERLADRLEKIDEKKILNDALEQDLDKKIMPEIEEIKVIAPGLDLVLSSEDKNIIKRI